MPTSANFVLFIIIITIIVIISSIIIVFAIKFQRKQKARYNEIKKVIEKNKDAIFQVKDSLTPDEVNDIDKTIDVNLLMIDLYNMYLKFQDKINSFDYDLDDIMTGNLKDFYINKIKSLKKNKCKYVKEKIELVGYSITEFSKEQLKFRININCFNYAMINDKIVNGSNQVRVQQILLLSFQKIGDKWLISNYEKLYEKKLSN